METAPKKRKVTSPSKVREHISQSKSGMKYTAEPAKPLSQKRKDSPSKSTGSTPLAARNAMAATTCSFCGNWFGRIDGLRRHLQFSCQEIPKSKAAVRNAITATYAETQKRPTASAGGSRSDQASSNAKSKAKVPKLSHPAKTTSHHKPPQTNLQPQPSTLVPAANHCGVCSLDVASAFSLNRHLLSTAHKAAAAAALATARTAAKNAAATYCGACSLNFATTFSLNRHLLSAAHKTAAAAVPAKDAKKNARANTAAKATTAAALVAAAHAKMYLSGSASTANTDRKSARRVDEH